MTLPVLLLPVGDLLPLLRDLLPSGCQRGRWDFGWIAMIRLCSQKLRG